MLRVALPSYIVPGALIVIYRLTSSPEAHVLRLPQEEKCLFRMHLLSIRFSFCQGSLFYPNSPPALPQNP